jgi:hypothetical protein
MSMEIRLMGARKPKHEDENEGVEVNMEAVLTWPV